MSTPRSPLEVLRLYPVHDYTLNGAVASRAACDPDRPFIYFEGKQWSWAAFDDAVSRIAGELMDRGVNPGDRVAIMGRNSDGHVLLLFALARLRAIMVPVNPEFGVEEACYVLRHAEVSGVVAATDLLGRVREARVLRRVEQVRPQADAQLAPAVEQTPRAHRRAQPREQPRVQTLVRRQRLVKLGNRLLSHRKRVLGFRCWGLGEGMLLLPNPQHLTPNTYLSAATAPSCISSAACAEARRATGTRNGEQET